MAKYEEKFIVINNKHINELPLQDKDEFIQALVKIRKLIPENKYLVCNQDEPYAQNVLDIILSGEDAKITSSNSN